MLRLLRLQMVPWQKVVLGLLELRVLLEDL
jgi:hypothetical protein